MTCSLLRQIRVHLPSMQRRFQQLNIALPKQRLVLIKGGNSSGPSLISCLPKLQKKCLLLLTKRHVH